MRKGKEVLMGNRRVRGCSRGCVVLAVEVKGVRVLSTHAECNHHRAYAPRAACGRAD